MEAVHASVGCTQTLSTARAVPGRVGPLNPACMPRTRRRAAPAATWCSAKKGEREEQAKEDVPQVTPDIVLPPPPTGSQYQPLNRPVESAFSFGGDGGGKGGGFFNLFTGGGSFGGGGSNRRGRGGGADDFAPFNRFRLMLLTVGWAISIYMVFSSIFKLLRAAYVKSGLGDWLRAANPMKQVQFQDDNRDAGTSEDESGAEYEIMQAGGGAASACVAAGRVAQQPFSRGGSSATSSSSSESSSGVGAGNVESGERGGGSEAQRSAAQDGVASASPSEAPSSSGASGSGRGGGAWQGAETGQQRGDLQHQQQKQGNAVASISAGKFSQEGSLRWNTMCAYVMILGTLAFFFHVR